MEMVKKNWKTVLIAILAILAVVFGILFIDGNSAKNDLDNQLKSSNQELQQVKSDLDQAKSNLEQAKADADTALTDAKAEAETALNDAKADAETALNDAKADAETALNNAKAEAETALNEAIAAGEAALTRVQTKLDATQRREKANRADLQAARKTIEEQNEKIAAQDELLEDAKPYLEGEVQAKADAALEEAVNAAKEEAAKAQEEAVKAAMEEAAKAQEEALNAAKEEAAKAQEEAVKAAKEEAEKAQEDKVNEAKEEAKKTLEEAVAQVKADAEEAAKKAKEEASTALSDAVEKARAEAATKIAELEEKVKTLKESADNTATKTEEDAKPEEADKPEEANKSEAPKILTHEEYAAADLESEVTVETFVQATQSWWDNKIIVYAQSPDGAYFIYNMPCSEEDAAKLVPGTAIRVNGYKAEWSGEIEIMDASFSFMEGAEPFIAEAKDVTALLGTDELVKCQNELVAFKGMTVEAYDETGAAFAYKNAEEKTDDLYFKVSKDGQTYDFCVEFYLCGQDTEVYKAVEALNVGDVIDLEGFLYWYNGANPHITKVTKAQ